MATTADAALKVAAPTGLKPASSSATSSADDTHNTKQQQQQQHKKDASSSAAAAAAAAAKRAPGPNAFLPVAPTLWAIHGQYYDLAPFLSAHPGGSEMLLLGRGRDCTEMFESVHAMSRKNVHALLAKYRVDAAALPAEVPRPPAEMFGWRKDGFYATLTRRVRDQFEARQLSHKATPAYWAKVSAMFAAWVACVALAFSTGALWAALAAGFLMNMIGFNVMHDASHYGISSNPWVNRVLHTLWSNWNLWSHFLWLRHHTYGHHSYTGVYRRDPDLLNSQLVIRKHSETKFIGTHQHQWWSCYALLWIFPNQHVGQSILYLRAWVVRNIFGVAIERISAVDLIVSVAIYIPSIYFHFVLPFRLLPIASALAVLACYWTAQGIGYAVNIIPNHDTHETHSLVGGPSATSPGTLRDWGEQQILGSGNHTTEGGLWGAIVTQLWGGMNYQIEHHLFPSVSHVHFASISPIVRETCREFNLPYVTHSWLHALISYGKAMGSLATRSERLPDGSFRPSKKQM